MDEARVWVLFPNSSHDMVISPPDGTWLPFGTVGVGLAGRDSWSSKDTSNSLRWISGNTARISWNISRLASAALVTSPVPPPTRPAVAASPTNNLSSVIASLYLPWWMSLTMMRSWRIARDDSGSEGGGRKAYVFMTSCSYAVSGNVRRAFSASGRGFAGGEPSDNVRGLAIVGRKRGSIRTH